MSTCQACCVFDWLKIETLKRQRISDSNPGAMTIRVGLLLLLATWQVLVDGRSDVKSTTKRAWMNLFLKIRESTMQVTFGWVLFETQVFCP